MRFVRVGAAVLAAAAIVGTQSGVASAAVWSPTKTLQGVFGISSPPEAPSVASNAAGHGVAVWDNTGVVRLAERVKGGAWTASRTVFPGSAWYGGPSTVAIGADETTAVAWTTVATRYVPAKLVVSVRRPGADFTTPVQVAPGFLVFSFRLGVAADGTVTLAWLDGSGVHASTQAPGSAWSAPQQLSGAGYPSLPDLVVNDAGAAVAVWQQGSSPGAPASILAAFRPAGAAAFDAAQVVSAGTGQSTWNPKPGISASGDAAVGYLDGASMVVVTVSRQAMTSSSPRTASSTGITGCTWKTNAGSIEQNLCIVTGSSHSINMCPPHSPTRITKNSILKLAGAFH